MNECTSFDTHDWDYTGGYEHCRRCNASYMDEFHKEMYRLGGGNHPLPLDETRLPANEMMAYAIRRVILTVMKIDAGIYSISADNLALLKQALTEYEKGLA